MIIFYYFITFILGLIIGSFLNFVIYRLEEEKKWTNRSYCPHCKHTLAAYDLIPVISFLLLGGKCRYCHRKISAQYPIVELATGLLLVMIFNHQFPMINQVPNFTYQSLIALCFMFYVSCSMLLIFVYDLKHYLIPDKVLFPAIAITLLYQLVLDPKLLLTNYLWAAVAAFLFFWLIYLVSRGQWMGFGDCKLVILLGLLLGFPGILLGIFLSFFFGAIIGLALMLLSKKGLKSQVPFAPFLIAGTFVAMVWGQEIMRWYLSLIFNF